VNDHVHIIMENYALQTYLLMAEFALAEDNIQSA
jgi:hypothetical protein